MGIEERLRRLEDIEAIQQLIARYAKAVDRNGDPALVAPLFTEDAVWHCEGIGHWETREGILREIRPNCTTFMPWAMHYMTQPDIEVAADGLSATSRHYLWELGKVTPGGRRADPGHLDRRLVRFAAAQGGRRLEVRPHRPDAQALQPGRRAGLGNANPALVRRIAGAARYFGAMRSAPSKRITEPLMKVFSTMCAASAAYSSAPPRRFG